MMQPVEVPAEVRMDCAHHWKHKMKGGQPLSVAVCTFCGSIDWDLLAEDFRKAAREFARTVMEGEYGRHDYPDKSRSLCRRGMVNVIQVYRLFSTEPGQDTSSLPERPVAQHGCFRPEDHIAPSPVHFSDCPVWCAMDHQVTERPT